MNRAHGEVQVKLLGPPCLLVNGQAVDFPTRKSGALCLYLAANGGRHQERRRLSGLLWGNSETEHARASLRKALSLLGAMECIDGLIGRDRMNVWFAGDPTRTDLATFNRCLAAGTERAYRDALTLWRGEPLQGLAVNEPTFDEWAATFRSDTIGFTHRLLSDRLAAMGDKSRSTALEVALCELIVRIEPTDTEANERLIRRYAEDGNTAAATRRFRSYAASLAELDIATPPALARFVTSLGERTRPSGRGADTLSDRPSVALVRPSGMRPAPDLFSFAHSEVIHQLTRFRSLRCFEREGIGRPDPTGGASLISRVRLSDAVDHDYRLLLWDEPEARSIYLRCVNARRQDTISCARIDYAALDDRSRAESIIAASINCLEQDILNDDHSQRDTAFTRWLEAYRLLTRFDAASDRSALDMLETLAADDAGGRLSLVHSSIASILMIRRMLIPTDAEGLRGALDRARESVSRALSLDEMEPFNHTILGWLRIQSGDHERGLAAFEDAMRLNPYSSRTVIAAAEANAYAGHHAAAQALAERALVLSGRYWPQYFHSYLANITYLSGDLSKCLEHLKRAPHNVHTTMLATAAHQERGDRRASAAAYARFQQELRRSQPDRLVDGPTLSRWIVQSNMSRDEVSRQRLFLALEQAGVPFSRASG